MKVQSDAAKEDLQSERDAVTYARDGRRRRGDCAGAAARGGAQVARERSRLSVFVSRKKQLALCPGSI